MLLVLEVIVCAVFVGHVTGSGPLCLSCDDVADTLDCTTLQLCGNHEVR